MTVPVLWVSWHDEILARGYADQAVLEAILDRSLWRPPDALDFDHREVRGAFPDDVVEAGGALVVLPSRHHVADVDRFVAELDRLAWSVVLLSSEEEWLFDWRKVYDPERPRPDRRLWVWQPRPEHEHVHGRMPCGWYTGTPEALAALDAPDVRPDDWSFGGQLTHERRVACVAAAERLDRPGWLYTTGGYFQGGPFDEYVAHHARARVTLCPSGPESLCTARVEEALEAGSVPLLDLVKPKDPQFDYWELVFGRDYPMPTISSWESLAPTLDGILADWPRLASRCAAFWQQWKRDRAWQLDDDLRAVSATERASTAPDDLVTVIVVTSPVPATPSLDHLIETIESVREQLPTAEIIVVADGVRPEQKRQRAAYEEALHRLTWETERRWTNVVPLLLDQWGHQANATRAALALVRTPLVLFVEHDTPLVGPIDWPGLCVLVGSGEANAVRFHFDVSIHPDHEDGMLDHETRQWPDRDELVDETGIARTVPVRRTITWWQRPHLARTDWYRRTLAEHFTESSRTMIEDRLYGIVRNDVHERGEAAWWDWRLWVYTPDDPTLGMKRSAHSDARGRQPKFPMKWE